MRITNEKKYVEFLEGAVITAGKEILKNKCYGKFVFLNYKDINALTKKYFDGVNIRQVSFTNEPLTGYERRVVHAMKVALNANHVFIYETDIVAKIKNKDKTIISSCVGDSPRANALSFAQITGGKAEGNIVTLPNGKKALVW